MFEGSLQPWGSDVEVMVGVAVGVIRVDVVLAVTVGVTTDSVTVIIDGDGRGVVVLNVLICC